MSAECCYKSAFLSTTSIVSPGIAITLDEYFSRGKTHHMNRNPDSLASWKTIREISSPVGLLHGGWDQVVPYWHSEWLAERDLVSVRFLFLSSVRHTITSKQGTLILSCNAAKASLV